MQARVRAAVLPLLLCLGAATMMAATAGAQIVINEVRFDQPGTDNDEFFELKGPASTALTGHTLLVIGDAAGTSCGTIEAVVALGTFSIQADGFFSAAEPTVTLAGIDQLLAANALNFENTDNVTVMLVTNFTGAAGGDIDTNDDGVIDAVMWDTIVDSVGLIGAAVVNCAGGIEHVYSATTVGPDGAAVPMQAYRCGDTNAWIVGDQTLGVTDTPGAANLSCAVLPPDIQDEVRTPCVPLTATSATVTVEVLRATSADLHWKVNGGSVTVVGMSQISVVGDLYTYEGTIPGQPSNGDLVEYFVVTHNANGDDQGFNQGYFVGTTPIGTIRVNDVDGLNVYRFYGVRVRGNVSVEPTVFHPVNTDFYIQDATGGINIFEFNNQPQDQLVRGDDITVTSSIVQFNGKLEISPDGPCDALDIQLHGAGPEPTPLTVHSCVPPESYEGKVVKIHHLQLWLDDDVNWGSNFNYKGINCGSDSSAIFIDGDTGIDGTAIPNITGSNTTWLNVTGIATQFDTSSPLTAGHNIAPRDLADLETFNPLAVGDPIADGGLWMAPSRNPFGASTEIRYRIPGSGSELASVKLTVVDIQGRVVTTLVNGKQSAGEQSATLDGRVLSKSGSGMYFLNLEVDGRALTRKISYLP